MKKILATLLALTLMLSVCGLLFSCGDKEPEHTHAFDKQVSTETYLKSSPNCTSPAVYYYSCSCGERGTETYENGDPIAHVFDQQIVEENYLKTNATTESPAVYYYSCSCGERGTETFTHGDRPKTATERMLDAIAATNPASVTTTITTVNSGVTLTASSTLAGNSGTVEYRVLNKLDIEDDTTAMTKTETLTVANGTNTIVIGQMNFDLDNFSRFEVNDNVLTATIENPTAFFGTTITTFTSADLTITAADGVVTAITVTYTTANGSAVTMSATLS